MVDKTSFNQDWIKMQQAFWGLDNTKKTPQNISFDDWLTRVDSWWKTQAKDSPQSIDDLYQKLLFSSRFFINLSEPFASCTQQNQGKEPATALVEYLEIFLEVLEKNQESNEPIKGFWKLPFDMWQHQFSFFTNLPKSFLQFAESSGANTSIENTELTQAYEHYFEALKKYQTGYVSMSLTAATELMQYLQSPDEKKVSTEDVCNHWVALFEDHYGEFVRNDEYSVLYADVVNSWVMLVQKTEHVITPWLKSMNMPTREDMKNIEQKQTELARENKKLKQEIVELQESK